jgi:hypothetical protein
MPGVQTTYGLVRAGLGRKRKRGGSLLNDVIGRAKLPRPLGMGRRRRRGGNIFGDIWNGGKKGANWVAGAAKTVHGCVKRHRIISRTLGLAPGVGGLLSSVAADQLGYGRRMKVRKVARKRGGSLVDILSRVRLPRRRMVRRPVGMGRKRRVGRPRKRGGSVASVLGHIATARAIHGLAGMARDFRASKQPRKYSRLAQYASSRFKSRGHVVIPYALDNHIIPTLQMNGLGHHSRMRGNGLFGSQLARPKF